MKKINSYIAILSLMIITTIYAQAQTLTATTDRVTLSENETLELTIRFDERVDFGSPNFDKLAENFDILNQRRGDQIELFDTGAGYWTEWNLALSPKKVGELEIPAFTIRGASSEPIAISVKPSSPATPGELKDIFLEVTTDKEEVYVQEQLLLTVRINTGLLFRDIRISKELAVENAVVEKISETIYNKQLQGKLYRVIEMKYVIFPQKSEPLKIPSLSWNLVMATTKSSRLNSRFNTPGTLMRLRSEEIVVPVKPKAATFTGPEWMPAQEVSIEQHWSSSTSKLVVGEPITRTLTLRALGLSAAQIPPLPEQQISGLKMYSDQPQFDDLRTHTGLKGNRIESQAIVPTKAGTIILPEVQVAWWDTVNDYQRFATLPEQVLTIAPSAANASIPPPLPGQTPTLNDPALTSDADIENSENISVGFSLNKTWPWIASNLAFASLALLFFIAWQRKASAQQSSQEDDDKAKLELKINDVFHTIRKACSEQKPKAARTALSQWGGLYWGINHTLSLQEIAQRSGSPVLTKALEELDEILYGKQNIPEQSWDGNGLWQALVTFKKQNKDKVKRINIAEKHLPPLYPKQL
ncbi:BatD family protein [Aurantivibrio infirmus]